MLIIFKKNSLNFRPDPAAALIESGHKSLIVTPGGQAQTSSSGGSVLGSVGGPSRSASSRSGLSVRNRAALMDSRPVKVDSDGESMERSLALLTAQYEKNNRSSVNSQASNNMLHYS